MRFAVIVIESANNQKLMLEYEKYQELQTRSMRMQEDYEKQIAELDDRSNKAQQELEEHYNRYVSYCLWKFLNDLNLCFCNSFVLK